MKEVEVKILEIDKEKLIMKILDLGAKKSFEGKVEAFRFDFPDNRLSKEGDVFRLRKLGETNELTFKKSLSRGKAKVMEETNIIVDDFDEMYNMLLNLGFVEIKKLFKYRTTYILGNIHFEIEEIPELPPYLEIEAQSIGDLEKAVKSLGLTMDDTNDWSMSEVIEYYKRKS